MASVSGWNLHNRYPGFNGRRADVNCKPELKVRLYTLYIYSYVEIKLELYLGSQFVP